MITSQRFARPADAETVRRIQAMAKAHSLLSRSRWQGVSLADETPPLAEVAWRPSYRLIASRFPTVGLFDAIADPADLDVVFAIEALTNPRLRNELGQLRMDAPYCHRDFRRPSFRGPLDEGLRRSVDWYRANRDWLKDVKF